MPHKSGYLLALIILQCRFFCPCYLFRFYLIVKLWPLKVSGWLVVLLLQYYIKMSFFFISCILFYISILRVKNIILQHYKRSLYETFTKHEQAEYMIILEEDLDVSKDLMDFFSQLLPVYRTDESIYCISAWNDQVFLHFAFLLFLKSTQHYVFSLFIWKQICIYVIVFMFSIWVFLTIDED